MSTTREKRLYVRTDADEKARIELAARISCQTLSDFVRAAVQDRAEDVLTTQMRTVLSPADFEALAAALDTPPAPNEALRRAAREPRRFAHK